MISLPTNQQYRRTLSALALVMIPLANMGIAQNVNHAPSEPEGQSSVENGDIPEGFMIIEGDMIVPEDYFLARSTYHSNPWTDGIVPYEFDVNVSGQNKTRTIAAMAEWEARADVTFVPRAGHTNYVHIQDGSGNNSNVGMIGGRQTINMFNWSWKYIIVHELGHTLALWHEQSREDRDTYIQINLGNVQPGKEHNFNIRPASGGEVGPYDFDSVMHYGQCGFATCSCPSSCTTITVLPPNEIWQNLIGQRTHLSEWDARGMASLYGFTGPDCNANYINDALDIINGEIDDNGNGIPDICETPSPLALTGEPGFSKDRYVSIDPSANGSELVATRVTRIGGTDKYVDCSSLTDHGLDGWYALLIDGPLPAPPDTIYYCDLSGVTTGLHVRGCSVVPGNTYDIAMTIDGTSFSVDLSISTTPPQAPSRSYGDTVGSLVAGVWTAPDGLVTTNDIVAAVKKFSLDPEAAILARLDTEGEIPNAVMSSGDILRSVTGFAGQAFGSGVTGCTAGTCVPLQAGACE